MRGRHVLNDDSNRIYVFDSLIYFLVLAINTSVTIQQDLNQGVEEQITMFLISLS